MHVQIMISFAIAMLYSFFFSKLSSIIVKDETVKDKYKVMKYVQKSTGKKYTYIPYAGSLSASGQMYDEKDFEITQEYKDNEAKIESQNTKRFYILLITGVVGIIVSAMISNSTVSMGLSIGSVMLTLYATYLHWSNINEYMKLGLIAVSIGALIYTSYKFVPSFSFQNLGKSLAKATSVVADAKPTA